MSGFSLREFVLLLVVSSVLFVSVQVSGVDVLFPSVFEIPSFGDSVSGIVENVSSVDVPSVNNSSMTGELLRQ